MLEACVEEMGSVDGVGVQGKLGSPSSLMMRSKICRKVLLIVPSGAIFLANIKRHDD